MSENYYDLIESLQDINLEDSWVLSCEENGNIRFVIDAVLSKRHPLYTDPLKGEARCYKRAQIVFLDVSQKNWLRRDFKSNIGSDSDVDYGNIDLLSKIDSMWHIEGEWGKLEMVCRDVIFSFLG